MIKKDKVQGDHHGWDDDEDDLDGEEETEGEGGEDEETRGKGDKESTKTGTSLQSGCKSQIINTIYLVIIIIRNFCISFHVFYVCMVFSRRDPVGIIIHHSH